jgi:hypothetical protein
MTTLNTYKARISPAIGGSLIDVQVQANDIWQARRLIESLYGPVKQWQLGPTLDWSKRDDAITLHKKY